MNKNMNLPAEYAVLSEEEMTYTQGGSDIGGQVLLRYFFHDFHHLPRTVSLCRCSSDNGRVEHIESFDASWSCGIGGIS